MRGRMARWWGRWRVALRYGVRDARRHKVRTVLVTLMVGLPVAAASLFLTWLESRDPTPTTYAAQMVGPELEARIDWSTTAVDSQDLVGNPVHEQRRDNDSGLDDNGELLTVDEYGEKLAEALPAGSTLYPVLAGDRNLQGTGLRWPVQIHQTDLSVPEVAAVYPLDAGRLPDGSDEIALDTSVAELLGVAIGETVTVNGWDDDGEEIDLDHLDVTGLLAARQATTITAVVDVDGPLVPFTHMPEPGAWPATRDWYVDSPEPITWDEARAVNALGSTVISPALAQDPPPEAMPEPSGADLDLMLMVAAVMGIALAQGILIVMPAFAIGRRSAARSLAVVAASGGDRATLRYVTLSGAIVTGLVAAVAGLGLGIGGVVAIDLFLRPLPNLVVPPLLALLVPGGALLAAVAAMPAAWAAGRTDVTAALAGRFPRKPPRPWLLVAGAVLAGAGVVVALAGPVRQEPWWIVTGVVLAELGVILAMGAILATVGRVAPLLPLSGRFALRDAVRQRSRTVPAVVAVVAAVGTGVGAVSYFASAQAFQSASYGARVNDGVVLIQHGQAGEPLTDAELERVVEVSHDVLGPARAVELRTVVSPGSDFTEILLSQDLLEEIRAADADEVCDDGDRECLDAQLDTWSGNGLWMPLVSDGDITAVLPYTDPEAASRALGAGKVVVAPPVMNADGTATIVVTRYIEPEFGDDGEVVVEGEQETSEKRLAAAGAGRVNEVLDGIVLSPEAADELGLDVVRAGVALIPETEPTALSEERLRQTLAEVRDGIFVYAELGPRTEADRPDPTPFALALVGGVVALVATWLAAALAAADSRADLATLTAAGASPATRRRLVAAQAAVVSVTGAVLGTGLGILTAWAFVLLERYRGDFPDPRWTLHVPWQWAGLLLVGLPLLAAGAAWLVTRSRLELTRRHDM
ncbi:FtsX-like permease family protein [Myceligenerans indicum]|uniref:ABC3 transporter permease C-terminal domain-containing protein n=1 Tax=Myceligenerans indicum TaxID=2593663 RepID=A0ABS1LNU3_9MICO|nr:FtsX-like permease family protein [Myceligenerans indicum]MBL0887679.1 hypothetical protein [Myceligenerans indicum]